MKRAFMSEANGPFHLKFAGRNIEHETMQVGYLSIYPCRPIGSVADTNAAGRARV